MDASLYHRLHLFFTEHLDLLDDQYYDVLAAWTGSTYQHEKLNECTYLLFRGLHGSGKTRALKTLAAVAYKPLHTAYTSPPAIYRILAQEGYVTLFFDEMDTYTREKRNAMFGILNNGYERGSTVLLPDPHDRNKVKQYPVFGPKAVATIKKVQQAFQSRCIEVSMIRNMKPIKFRVDKTEAEAIRNLLTEWRMETQEHRLPDTHQQLLNHEGIQDYRLVQIIAPLTASAPTASKKLTLLAKELDEQRAQEDAEGYYKDLYEALETLWKSESGGTTRRILVETITNAYNARTGAEAENRMVGSMLSTLGLTHRYRTTGGKTGRVITRTVMDRLQRRFTRGQITLGGGK
jgi:hypothetical protein